MAKRTSLGRQKIAMEKIRKKNHLQVTFSKRRSGLFKKASELCTLCGVEIALVVFSPASKAFSFGHPDVDSVVDRYLAGNPLPSSNAGKLAKAYRNANVNELNRELTEIVNELEGEKKQGEAMDEVRKCGQKMFWWENPIQKLGLTELNQLKEALLELKTNVELQANKILIHSATPSPFIAGPFSNFDPKFSNASSSSSYIDPLVHNFGYGLDGIFWA